MPAVVDQMLKNGYSEKDCHKLLGGNNYMRIFEQVWRA
jgi:microsomal dipeptidase-like Zn-dependent dipeptidase